MAFVLPTFPITCEIFDSGLPPPAGPARISGQPCQLRAPQANMTIIIPAAGATSSVVLLLPPGTDIRDPWNAPINSNDYVEAPSGSGRFYRVMFMDDIAKGFSNEHRFAVLIKVSGLPWPTPSP